MKGIRYKAKCANCTYETNSYIFESTAQWFAEDHMMRSGHIVEIKEVR